MNRRVLAVDDERSVLRGLERMLGDSFELFTAEGADAALERFRQEPPFAVVLSDMRMPGKSGAELLAAVRQRWPDTTRMLLTGQTDIESAMSAINEGQIFRFLLKPCSEEVLTRSLEAGCEQHRLLCSERELLEKTLGGTARVLTEILGLVSPELVSKTRRLQLIVNHLTDQTQTEPRWALSLAASMSQLGCIALPPEILERHASGVGFSERDQTLFASHPETASRMLGNIPRLEPVAALIRWQLGPPQGVALDPSLSAAAELLRVAIAYDTLLERGKAAIDCVSALRRKQEYSPRFLAALESLQGVPATSAARAQIRTISVAALEPGMKLEANVMSRSGAIVVPKGRIVSELVLERLQKYALGAGVVEPLRVSGPYDEVE